MFVYLGRLRCAVGPVKGVLKAFWNQGIPSGSVAVPSPQLPTSPLRTRAYPVSYISPLPRLESFLFPLISLRRSSSTLLLSCLRFLSSGRLSFERSSGRKSGHSAPSGISFGRPPWVTVWCGADCRVQASGVGVSRTSRTPDVPYSRPSPTVSFVCVYK